MSSSNSTEAGVAASASSASASIAFRTVRQSPDNNVSEDRNYHPHNHNHSSSNNTNFRNDKQHESPVLVVAGGGRGGGAVEMSNGINGCCKHNAHALDDNLNGGGREEEPVDGGAPAANNTDSAPFDSSLHEKLGVIPLAVLVFYNVSGGPFGCEAAVRSAGNFVTLLGFLVMPAVFSVQEAYMTAELAAAFPESAGGVAWVETAFGNQAGWMAGYLGWVAGATDNAIYPVLFLDYLLTAMHTDPHEDLHPILRFLLLAATSCVLAYINWLGLPIVGKMSVMICLLAMSPFIILTIVGIFKVQPSRWFIMPSTDPNEMDNLFSIPGFQKDVNGGFFPALETAGIFWRPLLNNLFWNLNSFDAAAAYAADVQEPAARVWPAAMGASVVMVASCYIFPLLIAFGAHGYQQHQWVDGFLAQVAEDVVGPWLGAWTVFASGISNIALFQAELSADAFQLMGMADRGHVPAIFSTRSRHGTPTYGILLGLMIIIVMGMYNLNTLIEMLNFNYSIALCMEYAAFMKLRIYNPHLPRPYRIPLSNVACAICLIPTISFILIIMALASYQTYIFGIANLLVGISIYKVRANNHDNPSGVARVSVSASAKEGDEGEVVVVVDESPQSTPTSWWSKLLTRRQGQRYQTIQPHAAVPQHVAADDATCSNGILTKVQTDSTLHEEYDDNDDRGEEMVTIRSNRAVTNLV